MSYRRKAVCTICSNNYLHFARTLMDSLREAEPDWDRYLLLCDENNDVFDVSKEPFNVVELASLPLPNPRAFCFRYTILELNTAVKPWFLEWLFEVKKYDQVVYLDPDVYVYAPMRDVEEALETGSFLVLTPHLTGRLDDDAEPTEHDILKAGAYNLGFVALRSRENLSPFLKWWQEKVEFNCAIDFEGGLFVDQKWIDLVPGMFGGVVILRHDGYNVAYWNLRHRKVTRREGNFYVNGQRLVFFHFSGLDPPAPKPFSKHQDRFRLRNLGAAKQLVRSYSKTVIENGLERCRTWPYAFERFTDGTPILDCMRYYYRRHIESRRRSSRDPFALGHDYFHRPWAGADRRGPLITLLMRAVWEYRQDLQEYFPAIEGDAAWDYAYWFTEGIAQGLDLPDCCVAPVRRSLQKERGAESRKKRHRSPGGLVPSGASGLTRLAGLALPRGAKHWLKQLLIPGVRAMSGLQHATRRAARLVPKRTRHRIRALLEATVGALRPEAPALPKPFLPGAAFKEAAPAINIIGYLRAEHGVGEVPRLCAAACEAVSIDYALVEVTVGSRGRADDNRLAHMISNENPHPVNLFHVNADQMPNAFRHLGREFFDNHYNIGYWSWELPEFPDEWLSSFNCLQEVWGISQFVVDAVSAKSPLPVVRMPRSVGFSVPARLRRTSMKLPARKFLFLVMYDMHSFQSRKNPQAAVDAFRRAFGEPKNVALVIKTMNTDSYPDEWTQLEKKLSGMPGIIVINETLTRQEVYNLEALCDGFLSLHRSEGFGLGLAESMYLGKPVIGTNWSGNVDFMNDRNSCPVDYELVKLKSDIGPYKRGQHWAEPDREHAAWYMKKLVQDADFRKRIAKAGRETIRSEFSHEAVGKMYRNRLKVIAEQAGVRKPGRAGAGAPRRPARHPAGRKAIGRSRRLAPPPGLGELLPLPVRRVFKTLRVWATAPRRQIPAPPEPSPTVYRPSLGDAQHVGFFDPEPNADGVRMAWMGTAASVRILHPEPGTLRISGEYDLECHRRAGGSPETAVRVSVDGRSIGVLRLRWHGPFEKTLRFPECPSSKAVALAFDASQGFVPAQIGIGGDARKLALRIARVALNDTVILDFTRRGDPFMPEADARPGQPGINIVGYLRSELGLGESARLCAASAEAASIEYSLVDFNVGCESRAADTRLAHAISNHNPHPVNVLHISIEQIPLAFSLLGRAFFDKHYNVGFWHWELPELPEEWTPNFALLDEVWVPSRFVMNTVSEKSPVPVVRMPHAVGFPVPADLTRSSMKLPTTKFLFLVMYDMHSSQTRKNPQAAVEAFRKAFPRPRDVALVLKTMNTDSYPEEWAELEERLSGMPGVVVINRTLTRQEVYNLEALCDCFVSLHRSEGFGLPLAESMYLGKPVIGTNWSGNVDFMNERNSCPVDYALVELKRDHGPYRKGQHWAEPDREHAAWYMKKLVSDTAFRKRIAKAGKITIRTEFSYKSVGQRYRRRLELISGLL